MPQKAFNPNKVLSAATLNFGMLEMSLFSVARAYLTKESYSYVKNQSFTNCAKIIQIIVREKEIVDADAKIEILAEAIQLYKIRNKIFHNPLIPIVGSDGNPATINHGLLNTKSGQVFDNIDLKKINDSAVKANLLAGKIAEMTNDA
ncbi:hypothetical protein [Aurantivibrio infirmus]